MGAVSEFFSILYTITVVVFTLLLHEIVKLVRSITRTKRNNKNRAIKASQYLKFVEEKNPTLRFSEIVRLSSSECTVCLSEFVEGEKVRRLRCNHTFHNDCLDQWLKLFFTVCPLCRTEISGSDRFRNRDEDDLSGEEPLILLSTIHGNRLL